MKNFFFPKSKKAILNEKLFESEIRYRRLFETAKDGVLILDFETGKIVDANPFIVKMIAFPIEDILEKKLWEIGLFKNKEESEQAIIELKNNGYIRFNDMPIQRPSGKLYEVEFICNVYLENNIKVIQCNVRDISEQKQIAKALKDSEQNLKNQNVEYANLNKEYVSLNKELVQSLEKIKTINNELIHAKEKAEESDKLKSAFLANMSHEIRTPLNTILGFSEFLSDTSFPQEKINEFIKIIKASGFQLLSVISDVIDISTIESGQINIESEVISINDLSNEIYISYKKIIDANKINFKFMCEQPNAVIEIKSDRNRIKQILCNLINNAIKFTKEGEIEFGYKLKEKYIEFYVKDTGIGIVLENQAFIFDRFRQVAPKNKQIVGGNGLCLSISKALVEKLGGFITVTSDLGFGSTFKFTIPYIKGIKSNENLKPKIESDQCLNWNTKTILIVEDEIDNHTYLEMLLACTNAKLIHAWNGEEAIKHIVNHPEISLVLMDIQMSTIDGYEATREIKKLRPTLVVIAQTAFAQNQDKERAIESGCDNYISKPIDKKLFMKLINRYLS